MKKREDVLDMMGLVLSVIWGVVVFIVIKPIGLILTLLGRLLSDVGRGVYGKIVQALTILAFGALIGLAGRILHLFQ